MGGALRWPGWVPPEDTGLAHPLRAVIRESIVNLGDLMGSWDTYRLEKEHKAKSSCNSTPRRSRCQGHRVLAQSSGSMSQSWEEGKWR